jgi:redox-sensitive bicupin YhaK (pirin superfamily)
MKTIFHPANQRGFANHGWLQAAHSFSFAQFYDPNKVQFGLLRVLNDDIVAPAMGFGTHGHDNMEIVTIPLRGSLAHKDSLGSVGTITPGEVQIMSAGSGMQHSEFNASETDEVNLLQIWVLPKERNIIPRYDQKAFDVSLAHNRFQLVVSPSEKDGSMWINQDACFSLGNFDAHTEASYTFNFTENGAYVFVIEGEINLAGQELGRRDALGVYDTKELSFTVQQAAKVLVIEIPMN